MGRIIALGPGGVPQAPARDDRFRDVVELVRSYSLLNRPLLSPVCKTRDEADDVRRGIYRSARYFCSCANPACTRKWGNIPGQNKANPGGGCPKGGQRIGCQAHIVTDPEGKLRVEFRLFDKQESIREVVRKYGPDPEKWPYFAKRKKIKE